MKVPPLNRIRLVPFDRTFLDRSFDWLHDPEIKLMAMAPDFTREEQEAFFNDLPGRDDYKIWGVAAGGEPIGVGGIKNISGTDGEFWCYIGERAYWGKGIGGRILDLCEEKAHDLGVTRLTMTALETNERSLNAYRKAGFQFLRRDETEGTVTLEKQLRL